MNAEPLNLLWSYHYAAGQDAHIRRLADAIDGSAVPVRMLWDSGAYTAHTQGVRIDLDAFAEFARWANAQPWTVGVISLDVIGDHDASRVNYDRLRNTGADVIPVVHVSAPDDLIDYYAQHTDWLALGALVGKSTAAQMRWSIYVHRYVRAHHPHVRLHGLGLAHDTALRLPWYSVDTSSWGAAYRYGRVVLFDPATSRLEAVAMNGRDIHRHGRLVRDYYGLDPASVSRSFGANRPLVVGLTAASLWYRQAWIRRTRPVNAPTAAGDTLPGTHLHYVDAGSDNLIYTIEGITRIVHLASTGASS